MSELRRVQFRELQYSMEVGLSTTEFPPESSPLSYPIQMGNFSNVFQRAHSGNGLWMERWPCGYSCMIDDKPEICTAFSVGYREPWTSAEFERELCLMPPTWHRFGILPRGNEARV